MTRKITFTAALLSLIVLTACVSYNQKPPLNPLQIEAMQTRIFHVSKRTAFNAVVTVFQNLGYIVQTANYDTGFITAESPTNTDFFGTTSRTKTTAFITELTKKSCRIRINFVAHEVTPVGKSQMRTTDTAIENAQSYINAFNKIRQQIFVNTGMAPMVDMSGAPSTEKETKTPPNVL